MRNLGNEHFKKIIITPVYDKKISGMFYDGKEILVVKKQTNQNKKNQKHPTYKNKTTKVTF